MLKQTSKNIFPDILYKMNIFISAETVLKVKGNTGGVDIKFKLAGYNEDVLAKAGVTNPVSQTYVS